MRAFNQTKVQLDLLPTSNRCMKYAVALPIDGSEPVDVQEALQPVHHYNCGVAYLTDDETGACATTWRHPTPKELRTWLYKHGNWRVELELHTKTVAGHEIYTFKGTTERFFWAEVMTHRNSRNASSARAIPYKRMKKWIMQDPAMPMHYGANKPGMQSGGAIENIDLCEAELLDLLDLVYDRMDGIVSRYDLHKELINRYSEPWAWINWTASFSKPAFHNMLHLRCTPHALPSFQRTAVNMARLARVSEPLLLQPGEWHMPMVKDIIDRPPSLDWMTPQDLDHVIRWSVARSAWTSYQTVEEKIGTDAEAYRRHDDCVKLKHATPCEHQNRAADDDRRSGCMIGYDMYRMMIPDESCPEFDFSRLDTVYGGGKDYVIL